MASAGTDGGSSLPRDFYLTPHQQSLLFAALNANQQQGNGAAAAPSSNGISMSPASLKNSPMQTNSVQESPFLDNLDYDFADSSFDFSFASGDQSKMIGDISDSIKSESPEADGHEKRSHPDDDEDSPGNDAKRRENQDKVPKKPGRKPLTSEPTSKRKAQNRAAQRAFRERKEKHLSDLENKIKELEQASEAANSENSQLRAQVDKMNAQLTQYKHKMAAMSQNRPLSRENVPFGNAAVNSLNDVNFQFEFPKFGSLPGPPIQKTDKSSSNPVSPQDKTLAASPAQSMSSESKPSPASQQAQNARFKEDLAKFSNIFTPSMSSSVGTASRGSLDSANFSQGGATSSPSASSNSNVGASSSCGTSPEPMTQSPMGFKPLDAIGEEQPAIANSEQPFAQFSNLDFSNNNSLDWLTQQNGGQFDPQLFGGYREPQENILANPSFDEFFNDAFDADFFTPYNASPVTGNNVQKKNLIAEIDAKQDDIVNDVPPPAKSSKSCTELWDKLQDCPSAKSGDFDLDGLCSELTAKAKCSGSGPMVKETDFDSILKKYMGKDVSSDCVANKLGIEVTRDA